MRERLLRYVAEHHLIGPGDRIAVAVSGGADSVALLRLLLEARGELGIVLCVAHLNHKIRGAEADADEAFVRELAASHNLPLHASAAETPRFARDHHLGLEAAARQLRHQFFRDLMRQNLANKVATAHTLDDQAETVLLRLMRGTGTRGLAGIHPELRLEAGSVIRPLLNVRRAELRTYLQALSQQWREDASNADLSFTRNRVRHKLLPLMEQEFGAASLVRLAETAEIAREEEAYWQHQVAELRSERPSLSVDALLLQPLAMQRRMIRAAVDELRVTVDFEHVEQLRALALKSERKIRTLNFPHGLSVTLEANAIHFSVGSVLEQAQPFAYRLAIPGEVRIAELNCGVRFRLVRGEEATASSEESKLTAALGGTEVVLRNWHPGDRFWPLHSKSDKKVKELLKPDRVPAGQRSLWPVAEHQGEIVWVRGLPVSRTHCAGDGQSAIVVEEFPLPLIDADQP